MEQENKKNSKGILIILLLSLLGNGILAYLFFTERVEKQIITVEKRDTQNDLDSIIDIRVALESELNNTKTDLEKFKGYSAELDSLLAGAKEQLAAKEKKIAYLAKDSKKLKELQAELADLKKMRDTLL
jgi:regulatory protein YycI of two-component signal transduction system YycFG